jgi:polyisoprenoid-binding protein YceI
MTGGTRLAALAATAFLAAPAAAGVVAPIALAPPASQLAYTVFAFGLIPINASFQDFTGTLTLDPGQPQSCQVHLTVRVASLRMADPDRSRQALGPAMLDAAHYPTMHFDGHCAGPSLVGQLTLHGVTRPLIMAVQRDGEHVVATGVLQRRDYAIAGLPGLVGQRVRFRLNAPLPPIAAGAEP